MTIEFLSASRRDPLILANTMMYIGEMLTLDDDICWIADITTMTHEMLLITVAAAEEVIPTWNNLTFVYNVADQYSGDDEASCKWISQGIRRFGQLSVTPENGRRGSPQRLSLFLVLILSECVGSSKTSNRSNL